MANQASVTYVSEEALTEVITPLLERIFGRRTVTAWEVRSHGRARSDVAVWNGRELVTVEVKLRDWRRALSQALLNRLCADRSYVAMSKESITPIVERTVADFGVGLLIFNGTGLVKRVAARKNAPNPIVRARMKATVMTRHGM